jgi:hypothetical protein
LTLCVASFTPCEAQEHAFDGAIAKATQICYREVEFAQSKRVADDLARRASPDVG